MLLLSVLLENTKASSLFVLLIIIILFYNVYEKNKMLESFIEQDIIPPKDYDMEYTSQKVEMLYKTGEISKTKYNKYKENPTNNPIGDWRCNYCSFGKNKDGYSVCTTLDYKG